MGSPGAPVTYWQSLAAAADASQLYLDPAAAAECSRACDEYIVKLKQHKESAKDLASVSGWGDFDMGQQLQEIFAKKAVGGENNMYDTLQRHIDVVEEMKIVFNKFFVATNAVDEDNSAGLQAEGPN